MSSRNPSFGCLPEKATKPEPSFEKHCLSLHPAQPGASISNILGPRRLMPVPAFSRWDATFGGMVTVVSPASNTRGFWLQAQTRPEERRAPRLVS